MRAAKNAGRNQLISSVHMDSGLAWLGTTQKRATSGKPNHAINFDGVLWQHFANQRNWFYIENPPVCTKNLKTVGEP
jgi:hypothetical protein